MSDKADSFIPFFGRDFLAATMGWPDAAVGAYIRLLIVQWEQGGLPADLDELAAIAHTVAANWRKLESKFPVDEDGQRRNRRLEEHRAKAGQLAASRKAKAEAAARARWDAPSNAPSNAPSIAQAMLHTCPPSPSPYPYPYPSPSPQEFTHTAGTHAGDGEAGRLLAKWESFVNAWNRAKGVEPYAHIGAPPPDFMQRAEELGWDEIWPAALQRLARAGYFKRPCSLTQFVKAGFAHRIAAGEFDSEAKPKGGRATDSPMSLDEKLERDRREEPRKARWRPAPKGCPDDLAGRFFNAMLTDAQFDENRAQALAECRRRASVPQESTESF